MTFRKRDSLRNTLTANKAALETMAFMAGKPVTFNSTIRPKRETKPREPSNVPMERDVLKAVLHLLRVHPAVRFAWRMTSGMFETGERTVRVGLVGMPDVIGMLRDGRFFGCEVKRPGGRVSEAQAYRLKQINDGGGLGFVAYSADDVTEHLRGL